MSAHQVRTSRVCINLIKFCWFRKKKKGLNNYVVPNDPPQQLEKDGRFGEGGYGGRGKETTQFPTKEKGVNRNENCWQTLGGIFALKYNVNYKKTWEGERLVCWYWLVLGNNTRKYLKKYINNLICKMLWLPWTI